jgi:hypothetical protein
LLFDGRLPHGHPGVKVPTVANMDAHEVAREISEPGRTAFGASAVVDEILTVDHADTTRPGDAVELAHEVFVARQEGRIVVAVAHVAERVRVGVHVGERRREHAHVDRVGRELPQYVHAVTAVEREVGADVAVETEDFSGDHGDSMVRTNDGSAARWVGW